MSPQGTGVFRCAPSQMPVAFARMKIALLPCLAGMLLLSACEAPEAIKVVDVAGGKVERIKISAMGPQAPEDDNAIVELSAVLPEAKTKKACHAMIVKPKIKSPITRIIVREITSDPVQVIFDVKNPEMTKDGYWRSSSAPLTSDDPKVSAWVNHQSATMLVYETSITFENGAKSRLVSAFVVPYQVKAFIKKDLGL